MADRGIIYEIRRKGQILALKLMPQEFISKLYFRYILGYWLNLDNPQTFNEKLQWYKLYYCPSNQTIIKCGDKYDVREYIIKKGLGQYLNELLGIWDSVNDIDWENLPEQFAMKCTHGCGYNLICDSKLKFNIEIAKKKLNRWMNEDFGKFNVEPHYSKMRPKIICEKYLGADIVDYKFFCFEGEPQFMYIAQGFGKGVNERITFFDKNGEKAPFRRGDYNILEDAKLPSQYEKMMDMSRLLSKDFPFVRVDWFEIDGRIYFGELTFTPCGGMMKIFPPEYDKEWGKLFNLELSGNNL